MMNTQHARPWLAIEVAELRYGLAFGSSVEEIADFLQREVDDVRHQIEVEAYKVQDWRICKRPSHFRTAA
jgi:hypothetical protein